jgi:hypothetical protein
MISDKIQWDKPLYRTMKTADSYLRPYSTI